MKLRPDTADKIRDSFSRQSMMASIGAKLTDIKYGEVSITTSVKENFAQQHGFGHATIVFAIGDSAAGYAALSTLPQDKEVLTSEMKINLLAPAKGILTATGKVVKAGRRLVIVTAEVWADADGENPTHIALLQGTMVPVDHT